MTPTGRCGIMTVCASQTRSKSDWDRTIRRNRGVHAAIHEFMHSSHIGACMHPCVPDESALACPDGHARELAVGTNDAPISFCAQLDDAQARRQFLSLCSALSSTVRIGSNKVDRSSVNLMKSSTELVIDSPTSGPCAPAPAPAPAYAQA